MIRSVRLMNLHYGCGLTVGDGWYNCDCSPTLRLQKPPIIGYIFRRLLSPRFPDDVHYGDIVRGINVAPNSCDAIFCSHVLEHLSLEDCRIALRNTFAYLKPGGTFRLVVPDFEHQVHVYLSDPQSSALPEFMRYTFLGRVSRPKGVLSWLREFLGAPHHLWMWDYKSLAYELENAGFRGIRRCQYADSSNPSFLAVESADRFQSGLGIEATK